MAFSRGSDLGKVAALQTLGLEKRAYLGRLITPAFAAGSAFQGATANPDNRFRGAMVGGAQTLTGAGAAAGLGTLGTMAGMALGGPIGAGIGGIAGNMLGWMGADKYISPLVEKYMPGRRAPLQFRPQVPGLARVPGR
jgi:hypothetical protein